MAKTICKLLGVVFLIVGVVGFISHGFLGTHLSFAHNLVHILSGVVALYLGFAGSPSGARTFCLVFGVVYLLLGVLGFVLGNTQPNTLTDMAADMGNNSSLWKVIKGYLELGIMDHVVHVLLGIVFLIGGLLKKDDVRAVTD